MRLAACVFVLAAGIPALQQPPAPIALKPLKPDVYVAQGGAGANAGVVVLKNGVVLVDVKATPESARQMLAEIAKLTPKRVTHVILTHADADHVLGLAGLPARLTVIAHENAGRELEAALAAEGGRGPLAGRLPARSVVRTGEIVTIDGVKFDLRHWAPAHTTGDLAVYLPAQEVVFAGDLVASDRPDPSIDVEKGGSSEGWITSVKGLLGLKADQVVPGHGDVQRRADVERRLADAAGKRDRIAALARERKPLDQIKAALGEAPSAPPTPPVAAAPVTTRPYTFTEVVYRELTGRR